MSDFPTDDSPPPTLGYQTPRDAKAQAAEDAEHHGATFFGYIGMGIVLVSLAVGVIGMVVVVVWVCKALF